MKNLQMFEKRIMAVTLYADWAYIYALICAFSDHLIPVPLLSACPLSGPLLGPYN